MTVYKLMVVERLTLGTDVQQAFKNDAVHRGTFTTAEKAVEHYKAAYGPRGMLGCVMTETVDDPAAKSETVWTSLT